MHKRHPSEAVIGALPMPRHLPGSSAADVQEAEGLPGGSASRAWRSQDLLATLGRLCEVGLGGQVARVLDGPSAACPELLLLGLLTCTPWGTLHTQVLHLWQSLLEQLTYVLAGPA